MVGCWIAWAVMLCCWCSVGRLFVGILAARFSGLDSFGSGFRFG